jgi:5-methylcytosine-specific restriction protein A
MTPRKGFTDLQRLKIFEQTGGRCYLCAVKIQVGERWDVEHIIPLAMLGTNAIENLAPAHVHCHAVKTKRDAGVKAKTDRIRAKHLGAAKPRGFPKPPPGYDPWKRRMRPIP